MATNSFMVINYCVVTFLYVLTMWLCFESTLLEYLEDESYHKVLS